MAARTVLVLLPGRGRAEGGAGAHRVPGGGVLEQGECKVSRGEEHPSYKAMIDVGK